jgi:lysine-specific demethylase 8
MQIIGEVERVEASEDARVRDFVARGVPVVVSGLARTWTIQRKWTKAFLTEQLGAARVRYRRSPSNEHPAIGPNGELLRLGDEEGSLGDYLRLVAESPNVFLDANLVCLASRRGEVNRDLAPLMADVELPSFVDEADVDTVGLWLSGKGVRTRLHYDRNGRHNFNAQLSGHKDFVLVSPTEVHGLHPFPMSSPLYNFTRVNNFDPDLRAYPSFARVVGYRGSLHEGDLLFLPAFWYHSFTHEGELNLNINFWCDATEPRLTAVALRNELATILHAAMRATGSDDGDERWNELARELEHRCLAWSPRRATIDEAQLPSETTHRRSEASAGPGSDPT